MAETGNNQVRPDLCALPLSVLLCPLSLSLCPLSGASRRQDKSEAIPTTATSIDMMAAANNSQPRVRADPLDDACHGQTNAGPATEKALGNRRSRTKDTALAANPIRPIQTSSTPRRFTTLQTASG
jgi:hypothetical protein